MTDARRAIAPVAGGMLAIVLLVSVAAAVWLGAASLSFGEVWSAVAAHLGGPPSGLSVLDEGIVWNLRLPRILTAALVGAGLAIAGVVMQAVTRNQLADPFLLGLSSGASLGAVGVLLLGASLLLPVAAFLGALAALVVTLAIARAAGGGTLTPSRTVLAGVAVSSFASAITSLVIFWTATGDSYREILNWLLGSLAGARWPAVAIAAVAIVAFGLPLLGAGRTLDAFTFGDTAASALGVKVGAARWLLLSGAAVLTGALVSVSGAIGFVGLVVPHLVRLVVGAAHRALLPLSAMTGAVLLVWCDTIARAAFDPRELPVGVITAIIGAPALALLLLARPGMRRTSVRPRRPQRMRTTRARTIEAAAVPGGRFSARGICVRVGERALLDDVSLDLPRGSVTALVGPNGAGKSTLIRVLAGIDRPDAGQIEWRGSDWLATPRRERARILALVEQDPHTDIAITVAEAVGFGRIPHHTDRRTDDAVVMAALARVDAVRFADRPLAELSGGERQRIHLARALAQQPELLLLDEPTSSLDVRAQLEVLALLEQLAHRDGLTVLVALHDLALARSADHVIVLAGGRVVTSGTPDEVLSPDLVRDVYGVETGPGGTLRLPSLLTSSPRTSSPLTSAARRG